MDGQITICQQWIALWSDSLKVIPKLETHTLWENKSDKERNRACDYVNFYCSYKKKVSIIWEAWFFMLYVDRLPIMQVHIKREESFFFSFFWILNFEEMVPTTSEDWALILLLASLSYDGCEGKVYEAIAIQLLRWWDQNWQSIIWHAKIYARL